MTSSATTLSNGHIRRWCSLLEERGSTVLALANSRNTTTTIATTITTSTTTIINTSAATESTAETVVGMQHSNSISISISFFRYHDGNTNSLDEEHRFFTACPQGRYSVDFLRRGASEVQLFASLRQPVRVVGRSRIRD